MSGALHPPLDDLLIGVKNALPDIFRDNLIGITDIFSQVRCLLARGRNMRKILFFQHIPRSGFCDLIQQAILRKFSKAVIGSRLVCQTNNGFRIQFLSVNNGQRNMILNPALQSSIRFPDVVSMKIIPKRRHICNGQRKNKTGQPHDHDEMFFQKIESCRFLQCCIILYFYVKLYEERKGRSTAACPVQRR